MDRGSNAQRQAVSATFFAAILVGAVALQAADRKASPGGATLPTQSTTAETVNHQAYSAGQWKDSEQIYRTFCVACHGTGIGPVILGREYPAQAVAVFVRHGAYTMPPFTPSEINDLELKALGQWVQDSAAPKDEKGETK